MYWKDVQDTSNIFDSFNFGGQMYGLRMIYDKCLLSLILCLCVKSVWLLVILDHLNIQY